MLEQMMTNERVKILGLFCDRCGISITTAIMDPRRVKEFARDRGWMIREGHNELPDLTLCNHCRKIA